MMFLVLCLIALLVGWFWAWRRFFGYKNANESLANLCINANILKKKHILFNTVYDHVSGFEASKKGRTDRPEFKDKKQFVYGEAEFISFIEVLDRAHIRPGEVFYDLGCGSGKPLFIAALAFDLGLVKGIEIIPELYHLACEQREKFFSLCFESKTESKRKFNIDLTLANLIDVPLSDADILFVNATSFSDFWKSVELKLLKELKPGARVITCTYTLEEPYFTTLHQGRHLMSWGLNSMYVFMRTEFPYKPDHDSPEDSI